MKEIEGAPREEAPGLKPGELAVAYGVGPEKGRIVLAFAEPTKWIALDPTNAVRVAKDMIDKAAELGAKVYLQIRKPPLSAVKHQALVTRTHIVMKNQLEKNVDPKQVARQLVDIILSAADAQ